MIDGNSIEHDPFPLLRPLSPIVTLLLSAEGAKDETVTVALEADTTLLVGRHFAAPTKALLTKLDKNRPVHERGLPAKKYQYRPIAKKPMAYPVHAISPLVSTQEKSEIANVQFAILATNKLVRVTKFINA